MRLRVWIGIFATVCLVVCVLALILVTPKANAGRGNSPSPAPAPPAQSALPPQNYEGMLTDAHCGAKHAAAVGLSAADCTRACIHSGEHFALVDGDKAYGLDGDQAALKRMAGQRVKVVGTLNGNTISVASVGTPGS
jgi:hypothetical protein